MSDDSNHGYAEEPRPLRPSPCPICGKPSVHRYRPFCSLRCADVDLHRWLGGRYAIPAEEQDDENESLPSAGEDRTDD